MSGQHYYRNLPKTDVGLILLVLLLLISWFLHVVQHQKWEKAVKYLKNAVGNNLSIKNGGTKQTQDLYLRAVALYDAHIKEGSIFCLPLGCFECCVLSEKSKGNKTAGKLKMAKDPKFQNFVDKVVVVKCLLLKRKSSLKLS